MCLIYGMIIGIIATIITLIFPDRCMSQVLEQTIKKKEHERCSYYITSEFIRYVFFFTPIIPLLVIILILLEHH